MLDTLPGLALGTLDDELVARCRTGDERAWRELHAAHAPRVWSFLHRLGVSEHDVPDALQDVFVVVFRRIDTFDGDRSLVSTWILGIAVRVAQNHRRSRLRRLRDLARDWISPVAAVEDPQRAVEHNDKIRELEWILERMSPKLREAFVLYEIENVDGPDIADMLGCSEGTIRSRLRLAREAFTVLRARYARSKGPR